MPALIKVVKESFEWLIWLLVLSAVSIGVAVAQTQGGIVGVTIENRAVDSSNLPVGQSDVPVTFGQVFEKGRVPAGSGLKGQLAGSGQAVPIQVDEKATHGDGSLRHAVISTLLAGLTANQKVTLDLYPDPVGTAVAGIVPGDLVNSGYTAVVRLNVGGVLYSVSAVNLLNSPSFLNNQSGKTWLEGDQVTEWIVGGAFVDGNNQAHPHLAGRFTIRAYTRNGQITNVRTGVIVENNWTYVQNPSNWTYDVSVLINGQVVYTQASLLHYHHARWHKEFWSQGAPAIHVAHDPVYLMASGAAPNYDPGLINNVDLNYVQSKYGTFTSQPMGLGLATQYMPNTGAADGIGLLPRWSALYLLGQDSRAKNATVGMGDLGGSWSIHYRDEKTDLPVTIDDYPYICSPGCNLADTRNPKTGQYEITPSVTNGSTPFVHDTAHQPSFAYLPYLVSGDYYYLEELQFWANYNLLDQSPNYRGTSMGQVSSNQVRGQAWAMRTLGHAAYITPDSHPLKGYFNGKLKNNIDSYTTRYVVNQPNDYGALRPYSFDYPTISPWMDDFFTSAMGVLVELGYSTAAPMRDWKAKFPTQRMGFGTSNPNDFCWNYASSYHLQAAVLKTDPMWKTIQEVYVDSINDGGNPCASVALAAYLKLAGPTDMVGFSNSATGYPSNLQPALAMAVDSGITGAANAWTRFDSRLVKPNYKNNPNFAIVPRVVPINAGGGAGGGSTNLPPLADAGAAVSVTDSDGSGNETVTLDGSGSTDPDGSIVSYAWRNGSNVVGSAARATVTAPVGTTTFTLTVTDNQGAAASDTVSVVVNAQSPVAQNLLPIADAGTSRSVSDLDGNGSEVVALSGSASRDPDGTIAKYEWKDGAGSLLASGVSPSVTFALGSHVVVVTVTDNVGGTASATIVVAVNAVIGGTCTGSSPPPSGVPATGSAVATAPNANLSADLSALANLQPGQWYEVQNSRMSAVDPCPALNCPYSAFTGQKSVMQTWSGGAYDGTHDKFLIHGGGHTDYAGNEVYAFDVKTLQWERLTNPSTNLVKNALWFPDGTPNSGHSYDNLEYVPEINALCVFGNGSRWDSGSAGEPTACLDISTYRWSQKQNIPFASGSTKATGGKSAYDPVTRSVWRHHAGSYSFLHRYDSLQNTWQNYGNQSTETAGFISYKTTTAIDPKRRLFIAVGGGEVRVWDMTKNPSPGVVQTTTGATTIVGKMNPGLEYDPVIDKLVAWAGGTDVYTLDTATWVWSKVPLAATNSVIPTAAQSNGTYGRFRYIPSRNLYIAVNATNQNVYFFKLSGASGTGGGSGSCTTQNQAPVANAGADRTVIDSDRSGAESVVLDGAGSSDADGYIANFNWYDGATKIGSGYQSTVTLGVGAHSIALIVTDNSGASAGDTAQITVSVPTTASAACSDGSDNDGDGLIDYPSDPGCTSTTDTDESNAPNQPPVANAGPDQTLTDNDLSGGEVVTLDGRASTDPDGSIVSHVWREGSVTLGATALLSVNRAVGIHTITLTVTDNAGATSSDSMVVTVNRPPVANAGKDQVLTDTDNSGDEIVTLDGSASNDPDGKIVGYSWSIGGQVVSTRSKVNGILKVGTHSFALTVTDDRGATASDTVAVTVKPKPNQLPVAFIAGGNKIFTIRNKTQSVKVNIDGSKSYDPDGTIAKYTWTVDGKVIAGTASTIATYLRLGVHTVQLTVTDNNGGSSSVPVNYTVI